MTTRMEVADSDFVAKLASYAQHKKDPLPVLAGKNELREKAVQRATSYFMMGWHWDEIAGVLEDSGFSENDVDTAIDQAKKNVAAKLKEGPFSVLQPGQIVKLKSGDFGTLIGKREDFVMLQLGDREVGVSACDVDLKKTAVLALAFSLRVEAAAGLTRLAQSDPEEYGKTLTYRVKPDPQDSGKGYNWPADVPHVDPETGENIVVEDLLYLQQELGHSLATAVHQVMDLAREIEEENKVIAKETAELQEQLKSVRESKAQHESEIAKLVEEVLNTVEQTQSVSQEQYTYVLNFLNRVVILHKSISEPVERLDLKYVDEYKKFYQGMLTWADTQPERLRQKILTAMEEVKRDVIQQPRPVWKRLFEIIWPTREHRRTSQDFLAEVWNAAKSWVARAFAAVQKYFDSWANDIKPDLEEQISQVDTFIFTKESLDQAARTQGAVAAIIKRYK